MDEHKRWNLFGVGSGVMKSKLLISSILAMMLFAALGGPSLSDMTDIQVGACSGADLIRYGDGSWGKSVVTQSGIVVGSVKNWNPGTCSKTWYSQFRLTNPNYYYTLHTWRPNKPAYVTYTPNVNVWYYTNLIAKGGEYCNGVNIYYWYNGKYIGPQWQFLGCFNT